MTRSAGTSGLTCARVAAEIGHRVAHGGQVDDGRDAGEVLEQDAGGHERDLGLGGGARPPGQERLDVLLADDAAARVAQQVLEQDLDRHRQRARSIRSPTASSR